MDDLNKCYRDALDKVIPSFTVMKKYPDTLDSLQQYNLSENKAPQYVDQVDKAVQLLDNFTGSLFDAYKNMREDLKFALDPADQKKFDQQMPDNVQDALKRFDD